MRRDHVSVCERPFYLSASVCNSEARDFFLLDAWIKTLAYFSSWTTRDAPRWADLISLCFRCSNTNRENPLREIPFAQVEIARILFRSEQ